MISIDRRHLDRLLFRSIATVSSILLMIVSASSRAGAGTISYNRDIRPLLSDNCFHCHGPDQNTRKAKLRLDVREEAIAKKAFVPGHPDDSELIRRITTSDEEDLMPPPKSNKTLTQAQKELLRQWIADGAKYEGHWAYIPPVKPSTPGTAHAIDFLVTARLEKLGLTLSPEADRRTLARRLYFDLVGLPPTPEEVETFERDQAPDAYPRLVEKLLASPHFGERMAIGWLDVVRFADTIGYHSDNPRNVWPYRDYVIRSFNEDKPFDQFTKEQLAGDLLPNNTLDEKVGSAFNRLLLSTEEGGAQAKDYEARMLTDRVRAVSAVWLGQTIGCAQCHDHKFDPIKSRDFYSLGAFFADIEEPIIGRREDGMLVPSPKQAVELARLDKAASALQKDYDGPHAELTEALMRWEKSELDASAQDNRWSALSPASVESANGATLAVQPDLSILAKGKKPQKDTYTITVTTNALTEIVGLRIEALPDDSLPSHGPGRNGNGNFVLTEVTARLRHAGQEPETLSFASARASFEQTTLADGNPYKAWNAASVIDGDAKGEAFGWAILPEAGKSQRLILELKAPAKVEAGDTLVLELKQNHGQGAHTLGRFRVAATSSSEVLHAPFHPFPPKDIAEIISLPADKRDAAQKDKLMAHYKSIAPELTDLRNQLVAARKAKTDFETTLPHCLISKSSDKPRVVRILPRGNWMIETGDIVQPALPGYLTPASYKEKKSLNRLDLADWIVSRENPLTARVIMNRTWKQFFGIGLSKVLDDLGAQGEPPPNQALLDWLACEFMDSGWDLKHMIRLAVNSRVYKQISTPSEALRARDPYNRELAYQSSWRLDAELVRDNALSIAGLLVKTIGGPSVKPYQPDGYWENLNFPVRNYDASSGHDQYRRGLYTWWQRSYLHPSLLAFDAPSREECAAERNRSNIPQQALVLLNDPSYVEASRAFAARILREGGSDFSSRLTWAWHQALDRAPRPDETKTIQSLFEKHLAEFKGDASAAKALLGVGMLAAPKDCDPTELAAWTNVARVILNLHETITRS